MVLLSYCIYKGGYYYENNSYNYGIPIVISECMLLALILLKSYITYYIHSYLYCLCIHSLITINKSQFGKLLSNILRIYKNSVILKIPNQ